MDCVWVCERHLRTDLCSPGPHTRDETNRGTLLDRMNLGCTWHELPRLRLEEGAGNLGLVGFQRKTDIHVGGYSIPLASRNVGLSIQEDEG